MDKAFDVKMIADFIPTLAGYLPITLYILALSLIFGFILEYCCLYHEFIRFQF